MLLLSQLLLFFTAYVGVGWGRDRNGCSFQNNGCTYNINLQHSRNDLTSPDNVVERIEEICGGKDTTVNLDRAQSDYTAKIDDMEKNFSFLKDAHESRLVVRTSRCQN